MSGKGARARRTAKRATLQALAAVDQKCPYCEQFWNQTEFWQERYGKLEETKHCKSCLDKLRHERKESATPTENELFALRHTHMSEGGVKGTPRFGSQVPRIR